jgi:uncharacterized repeat protein (TIGR01451 family)
MNASAASNLKFGGAAIMKRTTSRLRRLGYTAILFVAASVITSCNSSGTGKFILRAITSLNPTSVKAGSGAFTLKVFGTGFQNTDVVLWNGMALATQPIGDPGELDALVPATLISSTGTVSISVSGKPFGGGQVSVGVPFTIAVGTPVPALTITKTHTGNFTQGQTGATYTITVTNGGTAATSGTVTVMDTIPTGLSGASASGTGWTCGGTLTISCTRSDALAPDSAYPAITLTVNVAANAPGTISNTVTVLGGGSTTGTATDTATVTPTGTPSLTITKTHTGNFTQGQTGATFTITVTNGGTAATSGTVTVTDTIPSSLTGTAAAGTGWTCSVTVTMTCTRSDALAASSSYPAITLTVSVASNAPATISNTVTVSGGGSTTGTATDTATVTPTGTPSLTITKTHTGNFTQGQTGATFTITVTNGGTAATSGTVTVTDTIPTGLTGTAAAGTGWTCSVTVTMTCTRSDALAASGSYPAITLTVSVATNAPATITNTVTVSGGGSATHTGSDTATVAPSGTPSLTITKTHTGNFTQGQTGATFTITVTNGGTAATSGTVTVTDTIPSGLTGIAAAGTGWACSVTVTMTCTRSDALAASGSYPAITLTVSVATNAPATIMNTVAVSGGGSTGATASDTVVVNASSGGATFTITMTGSTSVTENNNATVQIKVTNTGGQPTSGTVTVTISSPSGFFTQINLQGDPWACNIGTLICTRSDALAPGSSYPLIALTYQVGFGSGSPITINASVSGGGAATANTSITPAVVPCSPGSGTLCGQFGLFVQGYTSAGPKAIAASFTADGAGHITAGIMDVNSMGAPSVALPILTTSPSAYNFESNGFGNLIFNTSAGVFVFKFALNAFGNFAEVIEFEPSGTSSGSGFLIQQNPTFTPADIVGGYGFGLSGGLGGSSAGARLGMIGAITANGACGFGASGATGTINDGGTLSTSTNFSGTLNPASCTVDPTTGRGTGTFTSVTGSPAPSFTTVHFAYYILSANVNNVVNSIMIVSTDQTTTTQPVLSGAATLQTGSPYNTNAAIDCGVSGNPTGSTGCIFGSVGATGGNSLTGSAHISAGRVTVTTQSNTAGNMSLLLDDNKAGVINSGTVAATYSYNSDGTGTVTPASGQGTAFVLTGVDTGITMGTGGSVATGFFLPQTATNISTTSAVNFNGGTITPGTVGVTDTLTTATATPSNPTPSNSGALSGSLRFWNSTTLQNAALLAGTYASAPATGRGTGTSNITGATTLGYYVVNANQIVLLGLTAGDGSPVLLLLHTP